MLRLVCCSNMFLAFPLFLIFRTESPVVGLQNAAMPAAVGCSCILTELVPNFTRHIAQRGGQQQPSAGRPGAAVTAWRIVYKACSWVAGGGGGQARQAANLFRCLEGWWWRAEGGVSSQLRYTANLDTATHSNTSFRLSPRTTATAPQYNQQKMY